jgi:hypothetical protein
MTLDELLDQVIAHVRAGEGDADVEVALPGRHPAITGLELIEGPRSKGPGSTLRAVLMT